MRYFYLLFAFCMITGCSSRDSRFVGNWCNIENEVMCGCKVKTTTIWKIQSNGTLEEITIRERLTKSNDKSGSIFTNPNKWPQGKLKSGETCSWYVKSSKIYIDDGSCPFSSVSKDAFTLIESNNKKSVFKKCNLENYLKE